MKKRIFSIALAMVLTGAISTMSVSAADITSFGDSGSDVDSGIINPIVKVNVPTDFSFAVDAFEQTNSGTKISSTDYYIINKSNVPVKAIVSFNVKAALTADAGDAADKTYDLDLKAKKTDAAATDAADKSNKLWMAAIAGVDVTSTPDATPTAIKLGDNSVVYKFAADAGVTGKTGIFYSKSQYIVKATGAAATKVGEIATQVVTSGTPANVSSPTITYAPISKDVTAADENALQALLKASTDVTATSDASKVVTYSGTLTGYTIASATGIITNAAGKTVATLSATGEAAGDSILSFDTGVLGIDNAVGVAAEETDIAKINSVYTKTGLALADYTEATANAVTLGLNTVPTGSAAGTTKTDASLTFALNSANYAAVDGSSEKVLTDYKTGNVNACSFRFIGQLNDNAVWASGHITAHVSYNITGLSDAAYTTFTTGDLAAHQLIKTAAATIVPPAPPATYTINTTANTLKVNNLPAGATVTKAVVNTFNLFIVGTEVRASSTTGTIVASYNATTNTIDFTASSAAIKTALAAGTGITVTYTPQGGGADVTITK